MTPDSELESQSESERTLQRPESGPTRRRETLCQRAEDEENAALPRTAFEAMLKDPDTLYAEIVELIEKSRDLRAHKENYQEQLLEAKQTIRRNEALLDWVMARESSPIDPQPARTEAVRRTMKLPDPPLFDGGGKDGVTYDNWLIQVKNKLRGNTDAYPTEDLRIIYAAGRVSGNALALISPHLDAANHHAYTTVKELFAHLDELYSDPNKEKNARYAFKDLTMKRGQTFQEFYATFLRCVANGNISPQDLKDDLNDKLTWKLQEAVATYYNDPAITLSQFTRHCTTNDQQIRSRLEKRDRAAGRAQEARKGTGIGNGTRGPPSPSRTSTSKASDSEKTVTRRPAAAKADLKCYNCFEPGHISRDCPKPKTERTKQVLAAKLAALTTRTEADAEPENEEP